MREFIEGAGIILVMWMIISAGMIEIAGKAGILWGALITVVVFIAVYIYNEQQNQKRA